MVATNTLTPREVESYNDDGFVGPFDLEAPTAIAALRRLVDDTLLAGESPVYGIKSGRDWHLVSRQVYEICSSPAIVERVAALLGPDVILWRSQLFYKKPGDGETAWHQDHAFPGPLNQPSIEPPVTITAWIALDETNLENGCVEIVAATHKEGLLPTVAERSGEGIFGRHYKLARGIGGDDRIAKMALRPGQFFLFSNLAIHGSGPNRSDTTGLGMAVRYAPTSVRVYPGMSVDGQGMSLENYGCVLVRGQDRFGHNRLRPAPVADALPAAAPPSSPYDAGFKMAYRVGYAKGERHAARGVRVAIEEREIGNRSVHAYAKEYGDPAEYERGFKAGLVTGYGDGVEGKPFDARFGSAVNLPGAGARRARGPIRKIVRLLKRVIRRR